MTIRRPIEFLYDDSVDISHRIFALSNFLTIMMLTISTVLMCFSPIYIHDASYMTGIILLILLVSILAAKKNRMTLGAIFTLSFLCFAYFPISFFNENGAEGAAPFWFIYNLFLIGVLLKGRLRTVFFAIEELVGLGCYIVSFYFPQYVANTSSLMTYVFNVITLILVSMSIVTVINLQHKLFVRKDEIAAKQHKEIEALNASQNRFFSSMSHEIRTPINTIIGLNEMILREDISDEVAEDAVNIRIAGKLLLNLINDILDMSKVQAGDMHLLIDSYATGNMLSELVGMLWMRAKDKNLEFRVKVAPDVPAELMGDEVRIKQILMNILNNAIKYTKEGSISLSVECQKVEGSNYNMIYTVEDTGMGIKKEDIPYLFTAFKRVDEDNTKHIEGTGLGLSIVKQLLDLMGGKVTVNSVYTKGSTFIIEIPQKAASDKQIGEYDYAKKHSLGRRSSYKRKFEAPKARILAVDDNSSNLLVVTKLLRDTKVQIDTAASGAEALKMTLNERYDVIFMDHLMPEMDGIECFDKIRNQMGGKNKDTKVVVLTANAGEENRVLYANAGFNGYLVKPVSGEDLENELIRCLPKDLVRITGGDDEILEDTVSWMHNTQKKKRIAITTESIADIPPELISRFDIAVIPHKVLTSEGTSFRDGVDIDTNGVLSYMEDESHTMLPQPPDVKELEEFYAEQLTKANNIIHISVSSKVANSGCMAAMEAANSFDNVTVIDSGHLSSGQGIIVLAACLIADSGRNVDEVVSLLKSIIPKVHTSFIVDNLNYLARSGQVSLRASNLMNSFMAKPVVVMKKGVLKSGKIYFGSSKKVWKKYIKSSLAGIKVNARALFVTYVGLSKRDLDWIKEQIGKYAHFNKIYFIQASPAIAANCGPGTFGLLLMEDFIPDKDK